MKKKILALGSLLLAASFSTTALAAEGQDSLVQEGQTTPQDKVAYFQEKNKNRLPIQSRSRGSNKYLFVMGHGAGDKGAQGSGTNEREFTRNEVLPRLRRYAPLLKNSTVDFYDPNRDMYQDSVAGGGAWTISDSYASVTEIHLDSKEGGPGTGGHVIAHPGNNTPQNLAIAQTIKKYVGAWNPKFPTDGMSYRTDLYNLNILQDRNIPYRLVELGFINNPEEVAKIRANLDNIAVDLLQDVTGEQIEIQGGSIDQFKVEGNKITVSGWFLNRKANSNETRYLFFMNQAGHEVARVPITANKARPDVAAAYPAVANAGSSGFEVTIEKTKELDGDSVKLMGRASQDAAGNATIYDFNFAGDYEIPSDKFDQIYRMYNENSGEHFFTKNGAEVAHLKSLGWNYEGEAWAAPETGDAVYRLYNKNGGEHFYTKERAEADHLKSLGWNDEGIAWYSDKNHSVPIYRVYNQNAAAFPHHYTANAGEKDNLVKAGWNDEGIGWYGVNK